MYILCRNDWSLVGCLFFLKLLTFIIKKLTIEQLSCCANCIHAVYLYTEISALCKVSWESRWTALVYFSLPKCMWNYFLWAVHRMVFSAFQCSHFVKQFHFWLCVSFFKDEGVESDDLKKDIPLMPPPPDSCSMKLTIKEIWFSFAAPTNVRSPAHVFSRYNFTWFKKKKMIVLLS